VSFGGKRWPISSADLTSGPISDDPSQCLGTITVVNISASDTTPAWVFGTPFLVPILLP
jgi:hypothetical protein